MTRRAGHSEDGFEYRSAVIPVLDNTTPDTEVNRDQYSTLKIVHGQFKEAIEGLSKNFNAFELIKRQDPQVVALDLIRQIDGKQEAYDILAPLYDALNTALARVDSNFKEN